MVIENKNRKFRKKHFHGKRKLIVAKRIEALQYVKYYFLSTRARLTNKNQE